jgi:hypothetical protein
MWVPCFIMTNYERAKFIAAGKAEFVIEDLNTGTVREYKVTKHKYFDQGTRKWNVLLLHRDSYGDSGYAYLGYIKNGMFTHHTLYSVYSEESEEFTAFDSLFLRVVRGRDLPTNLEFYHLGRCAKCGRKLTDPASINRGLGPKCAEAI